MTSQQFNKLVNKKDLDKLEQKIDKKFASKDDLKKEVKNLVTKKDLKKDLDKLEQRMDKKFSTKDDLKNALEKFATRAFNTFASKEDLKELEKRVASKKDIDRLFTLMDSIVVKHQEIEAERTANIGAHDRIEEDIAKTNKRVTIVEKKFEAIPVAA